MTPELAEAKELIPEHLHKWIDHAPTPELDNEPTPNELRMMSEGWTPETPSSIPPYVKAPRGYERPKAKPVSSGVAKTLQMTKARKPPPPLEGDDIGKALLDLALSGDKDE